METLIRNKIERWRMAKGGRADLEDGRMQGFYHSIAQQMQRAGRLRLETLRVGSDAAATAFGLEYGGKYYFCQQTYNIAFDKYSPGRLLIMHALEDGFARGLHEFDMLIGDEPYKQWFKPRVRDLYSLTLFQASARGYLQEMWVRGARPWLARHTHDRRLFRPLNHLAQRLKHRAG